jgi:hypothetical protein
MTAPRRRGRRSLLTAGWWGSALTAALALIGLVVIGGAPGSGGLALRADVYNQMTGIGSTASAVTVNWTSGLLDSTNQPITSTTTSTDGGPELNPNSDRAAGTGPLFFYDSEFASLQVTVSQTENIGQQGLTVSWTGAQKPPVSGPQLDFLQMMECYGDSDSGPSPEGCEFGSSGMIGGNPVNPTIGDRGGYLCGTATTPGTVLPSTSNPPDAEQTPGDASYGCDPYEPAAETTSHCDTTTANLPAYRTCADGAFYIPFVPADDASSPVYEQTNLSSEFTQFNTNEVQFAPTGTDGTGQRQFETLTANQAPGLGCGELESNGQTRNCWLVIVPRGTYEPNGYKASLNAPGLDAEGKYIDTSPLSASNWAQRIQIHLGYAPLAANCPPDILPQAMVGTQVAFRAVNSWEEALNQQAKCSQVFSYTASTESENTTQLTGAATGGAGLAFTTVPIGSEATREGGTAPTLPTILYAPVAVTAVDFGFNINNSTAGQDTTPVNLTPALVARSLTQVYQYDLPDYQIEPGEQKAGTTWWAAQNPINITTDPEFQKINSEIPEFEAAHTIAPLLTGDHSGDNELLWDYVQSDPATAAWLGGGPADTSDPVQADPDYTGLKLGVSPVPDSFPVNYQGSVYCADVYTPASSCPAPLANSPAGTKGGTALTSPAMLSIQNNFDQAASTVLSGNDSALVPIWNPVEVSPSGSTGYWTSVGTEPPGQVFMWAFNDMPDLASYGLISAALCDTSGTNCVQPSVASVSAALTSATTDSAGLLQVNPATVPAGAYPLTDVIYAAVPTGQSAAALNNYADFISYAAGQGQTEGSSAGDLPAGYLPLTPALQTQAQNVVTQLRALAGGTSSSTASPTASATGTTTGATTSTGGTSTGGTTTGGNTTAGGGTTTGGNTTTNGGGTTSGTTTGGGTTSGGGTSGGLSPTTTPASAPATQPAATSTCAATTTPASTASLTASPSRTADAAAAATAARTSTACASSSPTPQSFAVLPPSAQAAAATTQATIVGSVRDVLIIVLIIGAAGALAGGLLRYGRVPRRGRRSRVRADGS